MKIAFPVFFWCKKFKKASFKAQRLFNIAKKMNKVKKKMKFVTVVADRTKTVAFQFCPISQKESQFFVLYPCD